MHSLCALFSLFASATSANSSLTNCFAGHARVRLFITDGGMNDLLKATLHAIPILAIPLLRDEFRNARMVEARGIGLVIRKSELTYGRLRWALAELLENQRFVCLKRFIKHPPKNKFTHYLKQLHFTRKGVNCMCMWRFKLPYHISHLLHKAFILKEVHRQIPKFRPQ